MKYKISLLLIVSFISLHSQNKNQTDVPGLSSISKQSLMKTVSYLASKELAGRLSGSKGYNKAAYFIANEFSYLNLKPLGDENYFQKFKVEYNEINSPIKLNLVDEGIIKKEYKLGKDFVCRGFTGANHLTAPLAFVGYGLTKPGIGYDDYAGMDVKGKIVIAFKYNPKWRINDTSDWGEGSIRYKISNAAKHGAVALLLVSFPNDAKPQKTILSILEGEGEQKEDFPSLHIDIPVADEFLTGSGFSLKELETKIDSLKKPNSILLKTSAEVDVHSKYFKEQETMNLVGLLEGSDEKLKDEYLVIGAHLDHVGSQGGEIFAPGANDNASGSAAVLEIARTFIANNIKPKRSIIFVLFASEEIGLAGAKHFVDNPPVPLDKITAMINLDCVGYGDSIQVGNGLSSPQLWQLARRNDSLYTKMMVRTTWAGGGADATPFHQKKIPCAYFVTTNSYEHLHCLTDTPETLNKDLFERITKLAYLTAYEAACGIYKKEEVK
ncbi:MAG: M20/M25/M40 family metallo-hydrolase [Ignavibacteriales bacterium]|nr:M20/M25/M40 family metallo-hydrolase [Ignavibacteriales bacterium]